MNIIHSVEMLNASSCKFKVSQNWNYYELSSQLNMHEINSLHVNATKLYQLRAKSRIYIWKLTSVTAPKTLTIENNDVNEAKTNNCVVKTFTLHAIDNKEEHVILTTCTFLQYILLENKFILLILYD